MSTTTPVFEPAVTRLSEVTPEPVEWLWPGRLPVGKVVVLDGDPGVGKSTLALDLAARVTTGSPMPDGHRLSSAGGAIILSAEDGAADTIAPRMAAAGGDSTRVGLLQGCWEPAEDSRADHWMLRPIILPRDLPALAEAIRSYSARLVIVDVLMAYLDGRTDSYRDQDVRSALAPLIRLAENTGACIVLIRHLSKSGGTHAVYRGGGSIGIVGAARVGLLVAPDPDDGDRRILAVTKCNVAKMAPAMAYRLIGDGAHGCARVGWEGTTTHLAADLLVTRDDDAGGVAGTDAADVLAAILADGPVWVKVVHDAMKEAGFTKDQTRRAKDRLKVRSIKKGQPGDTVSGWQWELPARRRHEDGEDGGSQNAPPSPSSEGLVPPSPNGSTTEGEQ